MIQGDPERLKQIVSVLVSNAIKYSGPCEKIEILCKVYEEYRKRYLKVKVKDHGIGIPNHMKDKIFTIFGHHPSFKKMHSYGSGLNLHIC